MFGFKLLLIFVTALLFDGLLLPAFFNFRDSMLSLLVIIIAILYMGVQRQTIILGLSLSVLSELFRGLSLGTMAIPFLFTATLVYLTQRVLDIKYTHRARFSVGRSFILAVVSTIFVCIFSVFLFSLAGQNIEILSGGLFVGLTIILEALILIFVFNVAFNKNTDYR
ncbi:MAG: hypothetical protein A3A98_02355 [Candidatus Staskawiczbacteria bacterium RIFCSPLOWO2_01_FULL_40_39]|nr:MAG: hypothetical protein A2651_03030 [Candidatus Yanofskybacteria bacterium RIFCSPHIGHO2_01_FULL_42_12]OGZ73779.1 MAG: hypothetical protein A3A98_02355 [Candidatus Staskawiczbacteria bacterium RIFCSPLOWO2_01_FULL_40_39]